MWITRFGEPSDICPTCVSLSLVFVITSSVIVVCRFERNQISGICVSMTEVSRTFTWGGLSDGSGGVLDLRCVVI